MFVEVPRVEYEKLVESHIAVRSEVVRQRVEEAWQVQRARFQGTASLSNADMGPAEVWESCQVEDEAKGLLQAAMKQLALSARAFHRVLKVARTIADLAGVERIGVVHLAEALQHRPRAQV